MPTEQPKILTKYRDMPGYDNIDGYIKYEGYTALRKALAMEQDAIVNEVRLSALRGRGGAGFPTFIKMGGLPKNWDEPHYLVVNADEGEPGTAKDRDLMNKMPHMLVEGCIIAAWAVRSKVGYIYIRGEYMEPAEQIRKAIKQAYDKGFLGKNILGTGFDFDLHVHMGAGSYECGEQSALMSSLMGERGMPRHTPPSAPLPVISGVWDSPTLINNVETIATLIPIINMGGAEYAKLGTGAPDASPFTVSKGTKLVTVSGHVKKPGNYEILLGTTCREIIYDIAGGIKDDKKLKFIIPGGCSVPVMTPDQIDTPFAYETLAKLGTALGSGGFMVFDESVSVPAVMTRLMHFYAHESCGKCTPCREGTSWLVKIHDRIMAGGGRMEDVDLILDICNNIFGRSFCALGDAAAMPLLGFGNDKGALKYFRHEYEELIRNGSGGKKRAFAPLQMAAV